MQLSPEESRKAIERIRKYGGFPPTNISSRLSSWKNFMDFPYSCYGNACQKLMSGV
ncbi:hypothetical protein DESPIG_01952 [Desulfovibrio piger ATCC 29098]|uniref:Uncharacterized protein n=1 Tax=Desulfovibrio piger ATCC 29098 TaxID=411464 RepID=B6WV37_9BACT|nr:hypothetical protein DESPIG_01952 [Desulfovibrio piger ATCC 29098]